MGRFPQASKGPRKRLRKDDEKDCGVCACACLYCACCAVGVNCAMLVCVVRDCAVVICGELPTY